MSKEKKVIIITMLLNFIVAITKLISGIIFNYSTLIADSLQSFFDFLTDIIANIASKIGDKRANKKHPFGYGMAENISNLFIGIILFLLGIYIFFESFKPKQITIKPIIFLIIALAIILKIIIVNILYTKGKKLKSNVLLASAKESTLDLIASLVVLLVTFILVFANKYPILNYANTIGSLFISILIFKTAINIIIQNIEYLLGVNETDNEITEKVEEILKNTDLIKDYNIKLMRNGDYYNLYLTLEFGDNITLKQLFRLENRLKIKIRKLRLRIKYITIEPIEYK